MTTIRINTSGLSSDMKPQVVDAINKIVNDPIIRLQIDSQTATLTFNFAHKGLVDPTTGKETARATAGSGTVTFNLDRMGTENGAVYFDNGSLTKKPFFDTAVHETFHIIYPDLTGDFHDGVLSPNNVTRGQEAAGEFAFRTFTTSTIMRIAGRPGSEEQDRLDAARKELNENPTTRPDLSGVIWDDYNTAERMRAAVVDKNSIYSAHLLPKAQGAKYDQAPDSNDPWVNQEISEDGSSTRSVFDRGAEPWSSETSQFDAYQRLQSQRVVFDDGRQQITKYDPDNTHPYDKLERAQLTVASRKKRLKAAFRKMPFANDRRAGGLGIFCKRTIPDAATALARAMPRGRCRPMIASGQRRVLRAPRGSTLLRITAALFGSFLGASFLVAAQAQTPGNEATTTRPLWSEHRVERIYFDLGRQEGKLTTGRRERVRPARRFQQVAPCSAAAFV